MNSLGLQTLSGQHTELTVELLRSIDENFNLLSRARPQERQICDTTNASVIFQLPDGNTALIDFLFVKADSSGNTVTIYPVTGQTIAGASSKVLSTQYAKAHLVYNRSTADWITL